MHRLLPILLLLLTAAPAVGATDSADADRGEYLARIGNCAGCHTAPGGEPLSPAVFALTAPTAPSSRPTSRRMRPPASATGTPTTSGRPCTTANAPTARRCIRPARTPATPGSNATTSTRSTPISRPCRPWRTRPRRTIWTGPTATGRWSISGRRCTSSRARPRTRRTPIPCGRAGAISSRAWATATAATARGTFGATDTEADAPGAMIHGWYAPPLADPAQAAAGLARGRGGGPAAQRPDRARRNDGPDGRCRIRQPAVSDPGGRPAMATI